MSVFSLILEKKNRAGFSKPDSKQFQPDIISFDAIQREEFEYNAKITKSPIEDGSNVTDHIILENPILKLQVFITNDPIDRDTRLKGAAISGLLKSIREAGAEDAASLVYDVYGNPFQADDMRASIHDKLKKIMWDRRPFNVVSKHYTWKNYVISYISGAFEANAKMSFDINLEQIKTISSEETLIGKSEKPKPTKAIAEKTNPKTTMPKKDPKPASPQAKSWALSLSEKLGGLW